MGSASFPLATPVSPVPYSPAANCSFTATVGGHYNTREELANDVEVTDEAQCQGICAQQPTCVGYLV